MKQDRMNFEDNPDLTLEQRRLLQAWLKIIGRHIYEKNSKAFGYLYWADKKAKAELTPGNYKVYWTARCKVWQRITRAILRHVKAESSIKYGQTNNTSPLPQLQKTPTATD